MSENGKIDGQRRAHQTAAGRYEIALQQRYTAKSEPGPVHGFGQTRLMSSKDIIFAPGDGLAAGMNAEIVIDWPRLRDDWIHMELVLKAIIAGNQDGVVEARIVTYIFRTAPRENHLDRLHCKADQYGAPARLSGLGRQWYSFVR